MTREIRTRAAMRKVSFPAESRSTISSSVCNILMMILLTSCHSVTKAWLSHQSIPSKTIFAIASTSLLSSHRQSIEDMPIIPENSEFDFSFQDSWSLITLGDLHMEDDMKYHEQARQDCLYAIQDLPIMGCPTTKEGNNDNHRQYFLPLTNDLMEQWKQTPAGDLSIEQLQILSKQKQCPAQYWYSHLVSLGDLGRKDIRHEPGDAGTTKSFLDAKKYFDKFQLPNYDIVTGNHDLEGLDEFATDQENLQAFMNCYNKTMPQFARYICTKTLLLGLSTVRFRDAPYSSHEVHIDEEQIQWFQNMVESHPDIDGWKILVFSHAPIIGSGLRVLQSVHVTNGCAWLNHCSDTNTRNKFIRIVQQNPQIKCWSSGHFHLSHDYQDALVQVGSCTFIQVGVMGLQSSRDEKRQTRFFRGCGDNCIEIYSINHHIRRPINDVGSSVETKAEVRLDATIDLKTGKLVYAQTATNGDSQGSSQVTEDQNWFHAYVPKEEDGCYLEDVDGSIGDADSSKVCWWHMADGKVLGLHQGQLVEYDSETLAPLGVVITEEQLNNREVLVVQNKTTVVLVNDETQDMQVVHPNADGSYWRKFQRNKKIRLEEKAREEVAKRWLKQQKQQRQEML